MRKVSIFFADLMHNNNFAANPVPLNAGYLANALEVTFKDSLDIRIFKHPDKLISALSKKRPDIVCLSNYTWNASLSLWFARYIKKINKAILVIMGGPNIRHDNKGLRGFLDLNSQVDAYIPLTGELPLVDLVGVLLNKSLGKSIESVYKETGNIAGVYLNVPDYFYEPYDYSLFKKSFKFGSPYLNGLLDEFISDKGLVPIFESNRGCPYSCAYCSWGIAALSHVYKKDFDILRKEFEYVLKKGAGQKYWMLADANFGIFPRDLEIAKSLKTLQLKYGYPTKVEIWWAKLSSAELVNEIIKLLGDMIFPVIAVQSLDKNVLDNIKRVNLNDSDIIKLIGMFHKEGREVSTDILTGLSGETFQSNKDTLRHAYELGFDHLNIGSVQVLPGSEIDSEKSRKKHGIITKYRRIANNYGRYLGEFVFEAEENIIASKHLSETEFLDLREIHFLNWALWSSGVARRLLRLGLKLGVNPLDVFEYLQKESKGTPLESLLLALRSDLKGEQFGSMGELSGHIMSPHIQELILSGKVYDKLMWKYLARFLIEKEVVVFLLERITQYLISRTDSCPSSLNIAKAISIDMVKFDFSDDEAVTKDRKYSIDDGDYGYLVDQGFLPRGLRYQDGILYIKYVYSKDFHVYFKELLRKFNFESNPIGAFYSILHYGLSIRLNYSIVAEEGEKKFSLREEGNVCCL